MTRSDAIARLTAEADRIRGLGVRHLFLFGSTARDEACPTSDVDVFVDQEPSGFGLFELVGLQDAVSDILGTRADVLTRGSLHPMLRDSIEAEAIEVF